MTEIKDLVQIEPIVQNIKSFVPFAEEKTLKAIELMASIESIEDDDDLDYTEKLLVKVRDDVYNKLYEQRKAITEVTDGIKASLMVYEKRVSTDGKEDNHYTRLRKLIGAYKQKIVDEKNKAAAEAEKLRVKEDFKASLESEVMKNLTEMVVNLARKFDEYSRNFFAEATVENFDEKAKNYQSIKPNLKDTTFKECFNVMCNFSILPVPEFEKLINDLKFREDYNVWKERVLEKVVPVLNEWRGRIPQLKEEKIAIAKAGEEEKARLEKEKKERDEAEEQRKKLEFDKMQSEANAVIEDQKDINQMSNSFAEQAAVQDLGTKGPVQKVMRFTDDKLIPRAIANILVICANDPKFAIYKTDKQKNRVLDDNGRAEYMDWVKSLLAFYVSNFNQVIPGTEIIEVAKVIIKK